MRQPFRTTHVRSAGGGALAAAVAFVALQAPGSSLQAQRKPFEVVETTVGAIHAEYKSGGRTARRLVQAYLDRIKAYDANGPMINSVITINPKALEEADRLDAALKRSGVLVGPLTVGGSSGGTGAAVAANFATIGVGQEGFASIRRPSTWNSIVGMRPTAGLVSRTGVWVGWPSRRGSLGPVTRETLTSSR